MADGKGDRFPILLAVAIFIGVSFVIAVAKCGAYDRPPNDCLLVATATGAYAAVCWYLVRRWQVRGFKGPHGKRLNIRRVDVILRTLAIAVVVMIFFDFSGDALGSWDVLAAGVFGFPAFAIWAARREYEKQSLPCVQQAQSKRNSRIRNYGSLAAMGYALLVALILLNVQGLSRLHLDALGISIPVVCFIVIPVICWRIARRR